MQEDARSLLVEVPDLVDLVLDLKRASQEGHQVIRGISDAYSHVLVPGMTIEIAADKRAIVGPFVKRVSGGVDGQKAMSRSNEIEERCFLLHAHRQLAGCVEHHRGIASEIFG